MTHGQDHGLTVQEVAESAKASIVAAMQNDPEALAAAQEILFIDRACVWDSFRWTLSMIHVATAGIPKGSLAVPLIVMLDPETGATVKEIHPEDAGDDVPRALVMFMRIQGAYLADEHQKAVDLWNECILEDEAKGEPSEDEEPDSLLGEIMGLALEAAVDTSKRVQAALMSRFGQYGTPN